jgi:hypothetical protein
MAMDNGSLHGEPPGERSEDIVVGRQSSGAPAVEGIEVLFIRCLLFENSTALHADTES